MDRRAWIMLIISVCTVAGSIVVALLVPVNEHWRAQSPDDAFTAIAHTQLIHSFIGMMPGQGSDKPARVTVYRGNQSCGSAWVPMVWMARDLTWQIDTRPRRAEIRLVAIWNLDDCIVERVSNG